MYILITIPSCLSKTFFFELELFSNHGTLFSFHYPYYSFFFLEKPNAVMIGRISKNETSAWRNVDPIYRDVFRNQIERYFECCIYCSTFFLSRI